MRNLCLKIYAKNNQANFPFSPTVKVFMLKRTVLYISCEFDNRRRFFQVVSCQKIGSQTRDNWPKRKWLTALKNRETISENFPG